MASIALNAGVGEATVQRMGNWKSRSTTRRYAHVQDESLRHAAGKVASLVGRGHGTVTEPGKGKKERKEADSASADRARLAHPAVGVDQR